MAITLFGTPAATPADNGTNTGNPTVVTPPASMLAGDFVVLIGIRRASSGTLSISEAGGQTWTALTQQSGNTLQVRFFYCTFNGSWSADPSITMGATLCNSGFMLVFRPDANNSVVADVALASGTFTAPSTPFTVTQTGITIATNAFAIATWHNSSAITYGTLAGAGWSQTSLTAQYRNTSGSDQTAAIAYFIGTGATGDVSLNESAGTAGNKNMISFKELPNPDPNISQAVGVADSATVALSTGYDVNVSDAVNVAGQTPVLAVSTSAVNVSQAVAVGENLGGFYSEMAVVSEVVQLSVESGAFTINVSDAVGVAHTPTQVISDALIDLSQAVGVADTPTVNASGALIVDLSEPVGVGESTGQQISDATINLAEAIGAAEGTPVVSIETGTALEINLSQDVTVTEPPFFGSSIPEISASEAVTATDTATLAISAPQINVSQAVVVTEPTFIGQDIPQIEASEAVAVTDMPTVGVSGLPTLIANLSELVGVADGPPTLEVSTAEINASEPVAVGENINVNAGGLPTLIPSGLDNVSVTDTVGLLLSDALISITQTVTTTDSPAQEVSAPEINISQAISAVETPTVSVVALGTLTVSVTDSLACGENSLEIISDALIGLSQAIGVAETPTVSLGGLGMLDLTVSQTINLAETASNLISTAQITLSETVILSETPQADLLLAQAITQTVSLSETATVQLAALQVGVSQNLSLTETATLFLPELYLSITQPIAVAETGVPYWAGDLFILVGQTVHVQDIGDASFFGVVPGTPAGDLLGWRDLGMQDFRAL